MTLETIAYSANNAGKRKAEQTNWSEIEKNYQKLFNIIERTNEYCKIIKEAQRYQKIIEDCEIYKRVIEEIEQLEATGIVLTPEERLEKALEMLEELGKKGENGKIFD